MKFIAVIILLWLSCLCTSCTAIRDTTPCNSSQLLDLREKKDLSPADKYILDSLEQRCAQYELSKEDTPLEPQENISGWIRAGIIVVGGLLVLYLSGVFN
jgi:hypothetical protein